MRPASDSKDLYDHRQPCGPLLSPSTTRQTGLRVLMRYSQRNVAIQYADRYLYSPTIGIFFLLPASPHDFAESRGFAHSRQRYAWDGVVQLALQVGKSTADGPKWQNW
ncbi:unnamed protein product [Tilletia controversa]|uniref:Uncharacterized protein n=3 Tax=Tilletia TaxID=13289 RepID=A0A8X7MP03_9BASI|nr:hypothetical protein CF328_g5706 [Tilletia controversa]KAE8194306.1 hypothetical protein CF335_g5374 [Tilletia laevis]KAE8252723.1 hypothetical protein A4X03_0g6091 [Tilletia caries]KAE8195656.1 hypothetical protein CF336_g2994 [Tilletia laevis]KAE8242898.1 hypothetical protein A4X06_0g6690 [Tilletia controversa]